MKSPVILAAAAVAVVVAATVGGLMVIGSPAEQRALRADRMRVQDLRDLQHRLEVHRLANGVLPDSLDDLDEQDGLYAKPLDPITEAPYIYRKSDDQRYQLCAEFAKRVESQHATDEWAHDAGLFCFDLMTDADRQPL